MREIYSAGVIFSIESYLDTMSIFYTHHLNITHMTLALVFLAAFEYRELIDSSCSSIAEATSQQQVSNRSATQCLKPLRHN